MNVKKATGIIAWTKYLSWEGLRQDWEIQEKHISRMCDGEILPRYLWQDDDDCDIVAQRLNCINR